MAQYLDKDGLRHYHDSLRPFLAKVMTQAGYDALPEERRKRGLYVMIDELPDETENNGQRS